MLPGTVSSLSKTPLPLLFYPREKRYPCNIILKGNTEITPFIFQCTLVYSFARAAGATGGLNQLEFIVSLSGDQTDQDLQILKSKIKVSTGLVS